MNRWAVALILGPAIALLAAIAAYWQTVGALSEGAWVPLLMAGMIFLVLALYASPMVSRVGRSILVTVALILDGSLGFLLRYLMTPDVVA